MVKSLLAATSLAALFSAANACAGYPHGKDLYKRDPSQDEHLRALQARHPQVNARVVHDRLDKRASSSYPASLTLVQTAALSNIVSGTTKTESTTNVPTPTPGSPSPVDDAQPLPAVAIVPSQWPTLDVVADPTTPQVQAWLAEIDLTNVPSYPPTSPGGCQNTSNAAAIAAASASGRCWWTCGGCTRAEDVSECPAVNTWGLTYDDGPSPYTPKLLNYLDAADLKATIFTVGSRAISRPWMLQYEYLDGHQICVHTWAHFPLTTLTNEQIVAELGWSKKAIYDITGVTPNCMRPPYGDIDDRVRYISLQMGLTPIIWTAYNGRTFDTQDWEIQSGIVNTSTVINNFDTILGEAGQLKTGFIVLEHDLYQQSVDLAVDYVLPMALANKNLTLTPVVNCLGRNLSSGYIETAQNKTGGLTTTFVGATGSGFVPSLTYAQEPLGGDVSTGPKTTLLPSTTATGTSILTNSGAAGGAASTSPTTKPSSGASRLGAMASAGVAALVLAVSMAILA